MSEQVEIRSRLQPSDRPGIETILRRVGVFRDDEVAIGLELVDETLRPGPSTDYHWRIAVRGGSVVGFACFGSVPLTEGTYDLYWIAVLPEEHGQGVAAQLDAAVTEAVREWGARWLLAETSSTAPYARTQQFYRKQGYQLLEQIPDFYRLGDGRMTFGKRLDRPIAG